MDSEELSENPPSTVIAIAISPSTVPPPVKRACEEFRLEACSEPVVKAQSSASASQANRSPRLSAVEDRAPTVTSIDRSPLPSPPPPKEPVPWKVIEPDWRCPIVRSPARPR